MKSTSGSRTILTFALVLAGGAVPEKLKNDAALVNIKILHVY
jgi:hypothetical protein